MRKRVAFFISDGTGITVESLGNSLLAQFSDSVEFDKRSVRFVKEKDGLDKVCAEIEEAYQQSGERPLIFETIVDPQARAVLECTSGIVFDVFGNFLAPLEAALGVPSNHSMGKNRAPVDSREYHKRIDAINFTLAHDDGVSPSNYARAQIILLGVSRSGKTPTSIYLAMQFGCFCANYPLTEEDDIASGHLPDALQPWRAKLFGLSINAEHLHRIRQQRRPNSSYSSLRNCQSEVRNADALFRRHAIPALDSTSMSIEDLASRILRHFSSN